MLSKSYRISLKSSTALSVEKAEVASSVAVREDGANKKNNVKTKPTTDPKNMYITSFMEGSVNFESIPSLNWELTFWLGCWLSGLSDSLLAVSLKLDKNLVCFVFQQCGEVIWDLKETVKVEDTYMTNKPNLASELVFIGTN